MAGLPGSDLYSEYTVIGNEVNLTSRIESFSLREVVAIPSLKLEVPRQEIRGSPRIEVKIPFSYHVVEHKVHCQSGTRKARRNCARRELSAKSSDDGQLALIQQVLNDLTVAVRAPRRDVNTRQHDLPIDQIDDIFTRPSIDCPVRGATMSCRVKEPRRTAACGGISDPRRDGEFSGPPKQQEKWCGGDLSCVVA